ncbi:hypothetical protein [Azohydromonas aeria]|uniref:hypothetical protein n=1 Tax=Azohydromonas aeria TaxID=2590212 RepID=UPI0018DF9403|nr:hypothetical protein [Azohydromonas aeria]
MSIQRFAACFATVAALAAPWSAAQAQNMVPFQAQASLTEFLNPLPNNGCESEAPAGGSAAIGINSGAGLGNLIGKFTFKAVDCVTSRSAFFQPPFTFKSREFLITTESGEHLWGSYQGSGSPEIIGSATVLKLSGTFNITGGSGRFAGVRGKGELEVLEDITNPVPATGFVSFSGRISQPR